MAQNYYDTLGVSKNATATEIKAAYRKLALQWHPDRNKEDGAEKKFKEINHAYETLTDPGKKQMYDQLGHDGYNQSGGRGNPGGGYSQSGPSPIRTAHPEILLMGQDLETFLIHLIFLSNFRRRWRASASTKDTLPTRHLI